MIVDLRDQLQINPSNTLANAASQMNQKKLFRLKNMFLEIIAGKLIQIPHMKLNEILKVTVNCTMRFRHSVFFHRHIISNPGYFRQRCPVLTLFDIQNF